MYRDIGMKLILGRVLRKFIRGARLYIYIYKSSVISFYGGLFRAAALERARKSKGITLSIVSYAKLAASV